MDVARRACACGGKTRALVSGRGSGACVVSTRPFLERNTHSFSGTDPTRRAFETRFVCPCRLDAGGRCGNLLESHARDACHFCTATDAHDESAKSTAARLYFDAYAAAVWTNSNALFVANRKWAVPTQSEPMGPSIHHLHCMSSELNTSHIVERVAAGTSASKLHSSELRALHLLFFRCTNPGSRGWEAALKKCLEFSDSRSLVASAVATCLTGMHSMLHPKHRPCWQQRMSIANTAARFVRDKQNLLLCASFVKEAVRRHLATTLTTMEPTYRALRVVRHPTRAMFHAPHALPTDAMQSAMRAFCLVGKKMDINASLLVFDLFVRHFDHARTSGWQPGVLRASTHTHTHTAVFLHTWQQCAHVL